MASYYHCGTGWYLFPADSLTARLWNWGRWARSHPHKIRAYSLESIYRNRSGQWDWLYPPRDDPPKIDERDALVVWKAIRVMPWTSQAALKYEYVWPWIDRWTAARKCKLYHINKLDDAVCQAEFMVRNLLTRF